MNWISNYVRPKINSLFSRRQVPENLWTKCDACGTMLFHRELRERLNVCSDCGHHMQIPPRLRFEALFDGGIFTEIKVPEPVADPLQFRDQKPYPQRLRGAQRATGEKEAMLVAEGEIGRTPVVAAAQDFSFMGGSMGMYVGNAIIAGARRAVETAARTMEAAERGLDSETSALLAWCDRYGVEVNERSDARMKIRLGVIKDEWGNASQEVKRIINMGYRLWCQAGRDPYTFRTAQVQWRKGQLGNSRARSDAHLWIER